MATGVQGIAVVSAICAAADPEAADRRLFGRIPYPDRRGFLKGAGLGAMAGAIGAQIPFHRLMPSGLIPAAFAG